MTPKTIPGSPKVEPDSSSKRWDHAGSLKSHKHSVSVVAGSSASLERSDEWNCDTECMRCDKDKGHDKIMKEVENAKKITSVKRARAHTVSMLQGMTIAGWPSMADMLNMVVRQSIPIQRNDDFTVEADHMVMSIDTPAHQNMYSFHHL